MKKAFMMIGVSGVGKSSVMSCIVEAARSLGKSVRVFSLDNCRIDMVTRERGQAWPDNTTTAQMYAEAFEYASNNTSQFNSFVTSVWEDVKKSEVVIVDNTNLTRKSRGRWTQELRSAGFTVTGVQVMAPLSVVLARQDTRPDKSVPKNIVKDMYMRQQEVLLGSEVDQIINIDGTKPLGIVPWF